MFKPESFDRMRRLAQTSDAKSLIDQIREADGDESVMLPLVRWLIDNNVMVMPDIRQLWNTRAYDRKVCNDQFVQELYRLFGVQ